MRSLIFFILQLFVALVANAQVYETVNSIELSATSNKSYYVNQTATLKPGFSHRASTQGAFFISPNAEVEPLPTPGANFIEVDVMQIGITNESGIPSLSNSQKTTTYTYFDGAQRNIQTINFGQTPSGKDFISYQKFDALGRISETRLPYASPTNSAVLRTNLDAEQLSFYTNSSGVISDTEPYAYVRFENSPLNRVTQSYGPGASWHDTSGNNNKYTTTISRTNQSGEVRLWSYDGSSSPSTSSTYPPGALQVSQVTDEQGKVTITYTDFRNQVILIKTGSGSTWTETYSIYNYSGDLCYIFSPEASDRIDSEYNQVGSDKQSFLDRWCFQFKYDSKGRLSDKRFPGSDWVYLIYDPWDRLIFTQDGNMRSSNKWIFTKYDRLNRPIITGTSTGTRSVMQSTADGATNHGETRQNNSVGYSNVTVPAVTLSDMLTISYYDDYDFKAYTSWDENGKNYSYVNESSFPQSIEVFSAQGKSTGSKIRVLGTSDWLNSISYYDKNGRIIQAITENYVGGQDRITNLYDFPGRVTKSKEVHTGIESLSVLNEFTFDHRGRPLQTWQTIASGTRTLLSENHYNELGQLIEKNTHSTDNGASFLQSIDYRYTIRGQIASINNSNLSNDGNLNNDTNDLFGLELKYNEGTTLNGTTIDALFNGGVSMAQWKTNNLRDLPSQRIFGYKYDFLNRLSVGVYARNGGSGFTADAGAFNEGLTYDKNGNIKTLNRYSLLGSSTTPTIIDQLDYKYGTNSPAYDNKGNQLTYIDDASSYWDVTQGNPDLGFVENTKRANMGSTTEYLHDANGNMTVDYNKGITGSGGIQYNYLNKPTLIPIQVGGSTGSITFTYDAIGNKLRKIVELGGQTAQTDYLGKIHYQNSQIVFLLNSVGRAVKKNSTYNYEYFHRDHQGNTRLIYGYEKETYDYKATLEPERSTRENVDFKNISGTIGNNKTPRSGETPNPQYSAALNGSVGPAKILTVANGDVVTMEGFAKYTQAVSGSSIAPSVFAATVASAIFLPGEAGYTAFTNSSNLPAALTGLSPNTGAPSAFIGYYLFSPDFTTWSQFGFIKVSSAASNAYEKLSLPLTVNLPSNVSQAYMYIYAANQTTGTTVFFDDISVVHEKNNLAIQVVQATDYYPFGLAISPLSYQKQLTDLPLSKNKYKFQKQERHEELNLGFDQFEYRTYDPSMGRFSAVDPLSDKYSFNSTYAFSENKVTNAVELEGLEAVPIPPIEIPVIPVPYFEPYTPPPTFIPGVITYEDWLAYARLNSAFEYNWFTTTYINYLVDAYKYDFAATAPYRELVLEIENEGWSESLAASVAVALQNRRESDGNQYSNYITVRGVKELMDLASQPLAYTGISTDLSNRYSPGSMELTRMTQITSGVEKGVARGIEQIIIELNNGGIPYPFLSPTVDNLYNSTSPLRIEYYTRKLEGYYWLYTNIPTWQTLYYWPPDLFNYMNNLMNTK